MCTKYRITHIQCVSIIMYTFLIIEPVRDKTNKMDQNMDFRVSVFLIEWTISFKMVHKSLFCCNPFLRYGFSKEREVNEI